MTEFVQTQVVNIKSGSSYDIYIGRGSVWGNPHPLKSRQEAHVLECLLGYCDYLMSHTQILSRVHELHGHALGCYCAPARCHGDILARLAEGDESLEIVRIQAELELELNEIRRQKSSQQSLF